MKWTFVLAGLMMLAGLTGCANNPNVIPNSDLSLRKKPVEFSQDAVKRHPYKADAPRAEVSATADIDYGFHRLQLANLSDQDWTNVEVWINHNYVVFVPRIERGKDGGKVKTLDFAMFYDGKGHYYESNDLQTRITQLDVYHGGKIYNVPLKLAD